MVIDGLLSLAIAVSLPVLWVSHDIFNRSYSLVFTRHQYSLLVLVFPIYLFRWCVVMCCEFDCYTIPITWCSSLLMISYVIWMMTELGIWLLIICIKHFFCFKFIVQELVCLWKWIIRQIKMDFLHKSYSAGKNLDEVKYRSQLL